VTEILASVAAESKLTLIFGASDNPERYAYLAALRLQEKGHPFLPIGIKKGKVLGIDMLDLRQKPSLAGIHTVTLYLGPANQPEWMDYLLSLQPKRIIFNPGTENVDFFLAARKQGVEVLNACTLVLLTTGQF
jgi:predicted CoA-binding protein